MHKIIVTSITFFMFFALPFLPNLLYGQVTVVPQIATVCPVDFTKCPEVQTQCPSEDPTVCEITLCPEKVTYCPEEMTSCPLQETVCVGNAAANTLCPAWLPTWCPLETTFCPMDPTYCPIETTMCELTQCETIDTFCPEELTQCTLEETWTFCPSHTTWCPDMLTECPEVFTECPESKTACPIELTQCYYTLEDCPPLCSEPCCSEEIYGEYSEQVELLRYFRDYVLKKTPEGREIIRLYYLLSPAIVAAITVDKSFEKEVKEMINEILPIIKGNVE